MRISRLFSNQLSQVIQWEDQDLRLLWYKFPSTLNEIKNASKLVVAPGQGCILVYEGKVMDHIQDEGTFNLKTDNHPFITTLLNVRQNFESEHKLFIYFYRKADILNQPWGTASPVKYLDGVYHIPITMGANGNFSYRIAHADYLYTSIIGNKATFTTEEMRVIVSNRIPQHITTHLAARQLSYQAIDANLNELSAQILPAIQQEFAALGLEIIDFKMTGTQFDQQTMERIGRVADVTIDTQAAEAAGIDYVSLEKLRALRDAARNEGGLAGIGAQMGAGMELGKQFNEAKDHFISATDQEGDAVEKLQKLNLLLQENIISQVEFDALKTKILKSF